MIGREISHYKILEKIGEGGMGVVYRAEDAQLQRLVALKFLPPHISGNPEEKTRFLHEARSASALNHPNITTIYGIEETPEGMFLAMEYVEGKTLKQIIDRESPTLKRILDIATQVCEGLNAAHKKEIVHRDIKSDNIMVTKEGQVKIMDFGLAKLKGATKLTKVGSTVGTAAYMSPEQAQGEEVDQRTDIFSFGVVLYELLSGHLPFKGEHQAAIIYSILNEEPQPIARFNNQVSPKLEEMVSKATAKHKEERYQHIDDLLADLRREKKSLEYVKTTSMAQPGGPPKLVKKKMLALVLAGLAVLILVVGYLVLFNKKQPESQRKMLAVLPFENLGSPEQEYFADGITEEITARLANIQKLGVIARTSVMQYKNTNKTVQQIGSELAVDYILEGTIRWQQISSGKSRVRVTPQLIRVKDATHLWADIYDEDMAEVFQVQSDIAKKVTSALDLALLEPERKSLEANPTQNVEAYNYYLRGNTYLNRAGNQGQDLGIALEMYSKAVELDPRFAMAYAQLSRTATEIYWHEEQDEKYLKQSREMVEKSFLLQPDLPEGHVALGSYYYHNYQYEEAIEEFAVAQKSLPNNAELLAEIGYVQRRQGKFEESVSTFKKAIELDPLSGFLAGSLAQNYVRMRKNQEAEQYYDRAIALEPDASSGYLAKAELYVLWEGGTKKARKVLEEAERAVDPAQLAGTWAWLEVLDGNYQKSLEKLAGEEVGEGDTIGYYLNRAQLYGLLHNPQLEKVYYDSVRVTLERKLETQAGEAYLHSQLGIVYAGLGRKREAIREGKKAVELAPISKDAFNDAPDRLSDLARIYVLTGEYGAAIDRLEFLLSIPSPISVPLLRIDPTWAPLRDHPRFQKLIAKEKST